MVAPIVIDDLVQNPEIALVTVRKESSVMFVGIVLTTAVVGNIFNTLCRGLHFKSDQMSFALLVMSGAIRSKR